MNLVIESLSLLQREERWEVTFSTYLTRLPPGIKCKWRFVLKGSEEARRARDTTKTPVLDLSRGPKSDRRLGTGGLIDAAKTGVLPTPKEDEDEYEDLFDGEEDDNPLFGGESFDKDDGFARVEELEKLERSSDFDTAAEPDSPPAQAPPIQPARGRRRQRRINPMIFGGVAAGVVAAIALIGIYFLVILPSGGNVPGPDDAENGGSASGVKQDGGAEGPKAKEDKAIQEIATRIESIVPLKKQADENRRSASQIHVNEDEAPFYDWRTEIGELEVSAKVVKDEKKLREMEGQARDLQQGIDSTLASWEKKIEEVRHERNRLQDEIKSIRAWHAERSKGTPTLDLRVKLNDLNRELGNVEGVLRDRLYESLDGTLEAVNKHRQNINSLVADLQKAAKKSGASDHELQPEGKGVFRALGQGLTSVELARFNVTREVPSTPVAPGKPSE